MIVSWMEICQMKNSSVNYFHFVEMRVKVLVKDLRGDCKEILTISFLLRRPIPESCDVALWCLLHDLLSLLSESTFLTNTISTITSLPGHQREEIDLKNGRRGMSRMKCSIEFISFCLIPSLLLLLVVLIIHSTW